jgi:hypothetical protein
MHGRLPSSVRRSRSANDPAPGFFTVPVLLRGNACLHIAAVTSTEFLARLVANDPSILSYSQVYARAPH